MRDFSKTLILDLKARVLQYAPYFDTFELINPTAPDKPVIQYQFNFALSVFFGSNS